MKCKLGAACTKPEAEERNLGTPSWPLVVTEVSSQCQELAGVACFAGPGQGHICLKEEEKPVASYAIEGDTQGSNLHQDQPHSPTNSAPKEVDETSTASQVVGKPQRTTYELTLPPLSLLQWALHLSLFQIPRRWAKVKLPILETETKAVSSSSNMPWCICLKMHVQLVTRTIL